MSTFSCSPAPAEAHDPPLTESHAKRNVIQRNRAVTEAYKNTTLFYRYIGTY